MAFTPAYQTAYQTDPPVILVEITAYTGAGTEILRYCTGTGTVVGGNFYAPRIANPGSIKTTLFADGTTSGESELGYGEVVLVNSDGGLDAILDYGLDGRPIVIKRVLGGVVLLLMSCTMEQPVVTTDDVSIRIKDPQALFEVPVQLNKYAGTNVLPAGLEGTDDIKGKEKPLLFGPAFNATPERVNTSRLIYQGNDGALQSIPCVYDKGVPLQAGANYASAAEMEATAPLPGQYRCWLGGGYFRLGSSPAGQVTFDGVEGADASQRTAAQIAKRIALRILLTSDLVAQDFVELDAANGSEVGIYINSPTTLREAMDQVLGSIGAWYSFDSAAKLNVGRLDAPSGTPAMHLTSAEILSLERQATNDEGRGLPAYKVSVNYLKNYTVQQENSLAGRLGYTPELWETHQLPSVLYWNGAAFGNGLFVVVGDSSSAAISADGAAWEARPLPYTEGAWMAVTYGNNQFVAVSRLSNDAATSPDGVTWTARSLPDTSTWSSVAYGNGLFVAVCNGGEDPTSYYATSPDGVTWTARSMPSERRWVSIKYLNGLFLAVGMGNVIATSADGTSWTEVTLTENRSWVDVAYGNGTYVILEGAAPGKIMTSVDAANWTLRDMPPLPGSGAWSAVTFGNGEFAAVATNTTIMATSVDGITWTQKATPSANYWAKVVAGNGAFVVIPDVNSDVCALYRTARYWLTREYRTELAIDLSVLTKNPHAIARTLFMLLVNPLAAQAEAARFLDLHKVRRDYLLITCKRTALPAQLPALGKTAQVTYPRFGYDAGKLFIFIGCETHLDSDDVTLYFWG
ncbi:MAG: hypothetical protein A2075_09065 [Geobacteraceae bacterium GWC2_58_44]|nr:MAG: hypothetical protein A2075_09065 [Geobacteraceae bacterium GWC2_58_44]HBG07663.1 hypothetical protein [Geobacter sp.]